METTIERTDADLSTPDVVIRILATNGNADERYPVPSKQRFKDAGEGVIEAEDLEHIATALIRDDTLPLGHLAALRVGYLWSERGGSQGGFPCFGRLIKASKALLHYAEIDYLVMLSADHLRDAKATRWQVEALVGHQLGHIEMLTTEKGEDRYSVKGHDFEGFAFEFKRWGAYLPGMVIPAQAASSAVQMGLVFEESEDDEDGYDPSVDLAPGVEDELGPVEGGAPEADWAEPLSDDMPPIEMYSGIVMETGNWQTVGTPEQDEHEAAVRAAFPKQFRDGDTCRACGPSIGDHSAEYCAGTTLTGAPKKSPKNRGGATNGAREESAITGESALLGDSGASGAEGSRRVFTADEIEAATGALEEIVKERVRANGNGHLDDFDTPNRDPERTAATLRQAGKQVVWEDGEFRHPSGLPVYSAAWIEGELRGLTAGQER